jgi:(p)ppGpp synthase/HD superfamily hydrolase
MSSLSKAIQLAAQVHADQADRYGQPYILHPLRVMFRVEGDAARIAAVLHDIIEDSPFTLDDLRHEGFSEEVVTLVDHLTRREEETYEDYIARAASHPVARLIKRADLEDNMDLRRMGSVSEEDLERLQRYFKAWIRLQG